MSWTPQSIPNDPTREGWSADRIRLFQYRGFEILFDYLELVESNIADYIENNTETSLLTLKDGLDRANAKLVSAIQDISTLEAAKANLSDLVATKDRVSALENGKVDNEIYDRKVSELTSQIGLISDKLNTFLTATDSDNVIDSLHEIVNAIRALEGKDYDIISTISALEASVANHDERLEALNEETARLDEKIDKIQDSNYAECTLSITDLETGNTYKYRDTEEAYFTKSNAVFNLTWSEEHPFRAGKHNHIVVHLVSGSATKTMHFDCGGSSGGAATEQYVCTIPAPSRFTIVGITYNVGLGEIVVFNVKPINFTELAKYSAIVPNTANADNKLADKDFVNSSIATNTAHFLGTYDLVEDLGLTEDMDALYDNIAIKLKDRQYSINGTTFQPTNNDYVYVKTSTAYNRFKFVKDDYYDENYNVWVFEFALNNSSFTAEQWATINSGLTSESLANAINNSEKNSKDYTDLKFSEVEMAKFPNLTIYGNPTINNGQVSNFSNDNYMKFPFVVDFQNRPFEIVFDFTTGTNIINQENILDSDFGLAFAIRDKQFILAISTNGTSWNLGEIKGSAIVVQENTTYRVKLSWDGSTYKIEVSTNGGTSYIVDGSLSSTAYPYPKQMYIGVGANNGVIANHFTGIINLNFATLKISNELVWQGMDDVGIATRLAIDVSNIDEAGKARIKEIVADNNSKIASELLPIATANDLGGIKLGYSFGIDTNGYLYANPISFQQYKTTHNNSVIAKGTLENALNAYHSKHLPQSNNFKGATLSGGNTYFEQEVFDGANYEIYLSSSAVAGDEFTLIFYVGAGGVQTFTINGDLIGFDFEPQPNTRVELNFLFDGHYWTCLPYEIEATL